MLGAVLGEYLGASSGLGVALLQAQSSFEVAKTFSIAIVMAALAGAVFALVRLLAHVLVPWDAPQLATSVGGALTVETGGRTARHASAVGWLLVSAAVVVVGWDAALRLFHLSSYFAKGPLTVLEYVTWGDGAGAHRSVLISAFATTVGDALPGYLAGTIVAAAIAVLVVNIDVVGRTFMPIAIALRSIPLVALVPVIILIFGGNLLGVTVLVGLVVFFPTLVNVVVGLRSAPSAGIDLIKGLGGSNLDFVLRVQLRYALPAFFASSRIAIPAALGGATLAEWLATGRGLGNLLVISSADSQYTQLWAGAIGLVVLAVACYELIGWLERLCLRSLTSVSVS
jgi:ABC-type nitrate/sulfonate/bicarbonate transport system permease component